MFFSIFSFWRKWRKRVQPNWYRRVILELEEYEKRIVPSWTPAGPAPQLQGERDLAGTWNQNTTGRITALAIGQYGDEPALFVGAAGGGVWRSTDFTTGRQLFHYVLHSNLQRNYRCRFVAQRGE